MLSPSKSALAISKDSSRKLLGPPSAPSKARKLQGELYNNLLCLVMFWKIGCTGARVQSTDPVFYDVKVMSTFISDNPALRKPTVVKIREVTAIVPKRNV